MIRIKEERGNWKCRQHTLLSHEAVEGRDVTSTLKINSNNIKYVNIPEKLTATTISIESLSDKR